MSEFTNSVKLSDAERFALLSQLDKASSAETEKVVSSGKNRRADERFAYRVNNVAMLIVHPGGTVSKILVCARNISAGGIGVLHGGFLHPDAECRLLLTGLDGHHVVHEGHVVACRHVRGRLHEIGVQFANRIEVERYLSPDGQTSADATVSRAVAPPDIEGRMLFVGGQIDEHRTLVEHIQAASVEMQICRTAEQAVEAAQAGPVGAILLEAEVLDVPVESLVERIREIATPDIVILLAATDDPAARHSPPNGVDRVLTRPVEASMIFAACHDVLNNERRAA